MLVEFVGLPGSGKTTLAAQTREALRARGMPCEVADAAISAAVPTSARVARRLRLATVEFGRHPVHSLVAARDVRATRPTSVRDGLAGTVQWLAVQQLIGRSRRRAGVSLLEEGPVQTSWTLGLRAGDAIDRLVPHLSAGLGSDLVVVVEAPLDQLITRLGSRRSVHSRTQRLPERERRAELHSGRQLLLHLLAEADRAHVVVDNDGALSPSELGRRVAEWVLRAA